MCKLNTRCSILAATNPKGKYDPTQDLSVNIALGSPLLSRFDLIIVLMDRQNDDWDRIVSEFILNEEVADGVSGKPDAVINVEESAENQTRDIKERLWPLEKIQGYITFVKNMYHPVLTEESMMILKRYYQLQRSTDAQHNARTTVNNCLF